MSKNDNQPILRVVPPSEDFVHLTEPAIEEERASTPSSLSMPRHITDKIDASIRMLMRFDRELQWQTIQVVETLVSCFRTGSKVLVAGNGGSAAEAQHFAAELVGRFHRDREPLPVIALDCNTSTMTAIANDFGYERVFSRQVRALGKTGDVLIGISTSGQSGNVINAVREAKMRGMKTIGFLSQRPGDLADMVDIAVRIPATETPSVQEGHMLLTHLVCSLVESTFIGEGRTPGETDHIDTM